MIHALIIDDEENGIISLELMIGKYLSNVKVVAKTTDAIEGVDLINNYRPDIVFLDINMPNLNGFELLEKIEYKKFHLVFTTAHEEYALKAIKKNAFDYLLKPIDAEDLKKTYEKVSKELDADQNVKKALSLLNDLKEKIETKVGVPAKEGIELVAAKNIVYIEAKSNRSLVVLNDKRKVEVNKSLKEYEKQLCISESNFIRLHNSFLVNINYVSRYIAEDGGSAVMTDGTAISISKQKKEEFLKSINFERR